MSAKRSSPAARPSESIRIGWRFVLSRLPFSDRTVQVAERATTVGRESRTLDAVDALGDWNRWKQRTSVRHPG
jgi:hypothetical protein